jgi:hypothetical protein
VTGAPKRYAILLLLAGVVLGVGTPLYLAYAAPHLSIYLRNPVILAGQAVPYVVCAGLDRHHGRRCSSDRPLRRWCCGDACGGFPCRLPDL